MINTIVNQEKIFTFELPWPAAAEVFGVLELAPAVRKQASALHKHPKGANLYLDYYRYWMLDSRFSIKPSKSLKSLKSLKSSHDLNDFNDFNDFNGLHPAGLIFDIDTFAVHDGPGIRMAVYLKGCSLACQWCHSPESRRHKPELIFMRDRCALCGTCSVVCEQSVHRVGGSEHTIYRVRCITCGRCVQHCPYNALAVKGYRISAAAVIDKASHLKPFFDHSGGGVTLTGGEVTAQADFAAAVLAGCQSLGIHTAIETSGACDWSQLEQLLTHTDLVLYDLKLMDEEQHRRWTGASNQQILCNAAQLAEHNVQVRVPLIPGISDTEDNLRGIFTFMRSVGLSSVALLPYNSSAPAKYEWLGLTYRIQGEPQSRDRLASFVNMARQAGLEAVIG